MNLRIKSVIIMNCLWFMLQFFPMELIGACSSVDWEREAMS